MFVPETPQTLLIHAGPQGTLVPINSSRALLFLEANVLERRMCVIRHPQEDRHLGFLNPSEQAAAVALLTIQFAPFTRQEIIEFINERFFLNRPPKSSRAVNSLIEKMPEDDELRIFRRSRGTHGFYYGKLGEGNAVQIPNSTIDLPFKCDYVLRLLLNENGEVAPFNELFIKLGILSPDKFDDKFHRTYAFMRLRSLMAHVRTSIAESEYEIPESTLGGYYIRKKTN